MIVACGPMGRILCGYCVGDCLFLKDVYAYFLWLEYNRLAYDVWFKHFYHSIWAKKGKTILNVLQVSPSKRLRVFMESRRMHVDKSTMQPAEL